MDGSGNININQFQIKISPAAWSDLLSLLPLLSIQFQVLNPYFLCSEEVAWG